MPWRLSRSGRPLPGQRGRPGRRGESGTGMIGSTFGLVALLAFLMFAVHLLFGLYASSVITANGFDAAREAAAYQAAMGSASTSAPTARAEARARARLGRYSERVHFDWSGSSDDTIRLRLQSSPPDLMIFGGGPAKFVAVDRTIVVRVERYR